ncbi:MULTISPECIES: hypothetical protein [Streptomyces]|uniref:Uncharacterized protein n=1 Tax=Streptomyces halstedii TaxID=1944 RepID=A0A6N9U4Q5_STRHA|nr:MULTISPECIES: hypothetical protein [Streptomyces]MBV7673130.1 hypothetical protein [Streptomyces halstedii]NEA16993.1 hypothetical protein [Streptomyces halstedii]
MTENTAPEESPEVEAHSAADDAAQAPEQFHDASEIICGVYDKEIQV